MSILAYTGLPGSGKSYSVVQHQILPAVREGREVVTNIPLVAEAWAELGLPGKVTIFPTEAVVAEPHKIRDYVTPGCVFVLDEVWRIWPQGMQATDVPPEHASLLAEHRHMVDGQGRSTQIVLVVQDLANISPFARRLVENTFCTTKLSALGLSRGYRVDIFHGCMKGATPPVKQRLRYITGVYKKEIYKLYKSQTMSQTNEHGDESKMDNRAVIWKQTSFILTAIAVPIVAFLSYHYFTKSVNTLRTDGPSALMHQKRKPDAHERGGDDAPGAPASGTLARLSKELPPPPRLIMFLEGVGPLSIAGIVAADGRVYEVGGKDCAVDQVLRSNVYRCRFRGTWVDASGPLVAEGKQPF